MADTTSSPTVFPSFDLPRELRDRVYGYATHEIILNRRCGIWVRDYARPSCRLVSRQFRLEYEQQIKRGMCLCIGVNPQNDPDLSTSRICTDQGAGSLYREARNGMVRFTYYNSDDFPANKTLEYHASIFEQLPQILPGIRDLQVVLRVDDCDDIKDQGDHTHFDRTVQDFFSLPVVCSGNVMRYAEITADLFRLHESIGCEDKVQDMELNASNMITYRGTPDQDPCAWRGLDLQFEKAEEECETYSAATPNWGDSKAELESLFQLSAGTHDDGVGEMGMDN